MLQPLLTPSPTNAQPNAGLVVPRPVQQEQSSTATRNITANPVRQTSEGDEARADSEQDREQRVEGSRTAFAFNGGGGRGATVDILV